MRYKGSILGFLWVLLKPFFTFLILFVVFSQASSSAGGLTNQQYAVYLLSGLIIYTFFQEGITWGLNAIMSKDSLIIKIKFNREIVVISAITMALINLGINLFIISIVALCLNVHITIPAILYVLLVCLTLFIAMYGVSFFTSIWMVHIRDLAHIMELVLQLLFYATAIFYPVEMIPEKYRFIVNWNPIAIFIRTVRSALIYNKYENINFVLCALLVSIILVLLGRRYFNKKIIKIAEYF